MIKFFSKYTLTFISLGLLLISFSGTIYASSIDGTSSVEKKGKMEIRMDGLVPVCHRVIDGKDTDVPCESFEQLLIAVKSVINFAVKFVLMFTVVIIAWAGWLYMSSGGNSGKRQEANKMFVNVGWGIFYIMAAWLIVTLITNALLKDEFIDNSILK